MFNKTKIRLVTTSHSRNVICGIYKKVNADNYILKLVILISHQDDVI